VVFVATNYSEVLRPLQWLVIVLVFLFFLRVVRAVWVEVRPAGPRQTRRERRRAAREEAKALLGATPSGRKQKKQLFLEVLEPPDQAGRAFNLQDELTVGRSPGCGVPTTYDVYSSTLHARLYRRGEQLLVEDLGSTNGTYVNSERIAKATKLARGDLLQIGATVFEVTR
jgi:pSer/pThr/pTyr-binding forkhead associated (FHA) protein